MNQVQKNYLEAKNNWVDILDKMDRGEKIPREVENDLADKLTDAEDSLINFAEPYLLSDGITQERMNALKGAFLEYEDICGNLMNYKFYEE